MKKWSKSRKICAGVVLFTALTVMVICIIIQYRNRYYINPVSVFVYYEPESKMIKICEDGEVKEEIYISSGQYGWVEKYYGYDGDTVLLITLDNVYMYADGKLTGMSKSEWQMLSLMCGETRLAVVSASARQLAYVENDDLYLLDMEKQETVLIDKGVNTNNILISQNGKAVSYESGYMKYVYSGGKITHKEYLHIYSITDKGEGYCETYGEKGCELSYFYQDGSYVVVSKHLEESEYKAINIAGNQIMYYEDIKYVDNTENSSNILYIADKDKKVKITDMGKSVIMQYFGTYSKMHDPNYGYTGGCLWDDYYMAYPCKNSLYDSYIGLHGMQYINDNGILERITGDYVLNFAAPRKTYFVYYVANKDLDDGNYISCALYVYDKKKKTAEDIADKCSDVQSYMNVGAYLLLDCDDDEKNEYVYYINDGQNFSYVMNGIEKIKIYGKYVYLFERLGDDYYYSYNIYIGNPEEGYKLLAANVKYMRDDNVLFRMK